MTVRINRRALATGLLAAVAGPASGQSAPVLRGGAIDPIYAAIDAVHLATGALRAAIRKLDDADPISVQIADEASDRASDARNALSSVRPTTPAGLQALVHFHASDVMALEPDTAGAPALRDLVKAVDALLQARGSPG